MILEVGKTYTTVHGMVIDIIYEDEDGAMLGLVQAEGREARWYNKDGTLYAFDDSCHSLVSEVPFKMDVWERNGVYYFSGVYGRNRITLVESDVELPEFIIKFHEDTPRLIVNTKPSGGKRAIGMERQCS